MSVSLLRELLARLEAQGEAVDSDCIRVLSLARQIIESEGRTREYPTLKFYADWSLHAMLDRSQAGSALLDEFDALVKRDLAGSKVEFPIEVSKLLGVGSLRRELRALLKELGLPTALTDVDSNWDGVVGKVLRELLGRPIQRRTPGAPIPTGHPSGLGVSAERLWLEVEDPGSGPALYWNVRIHSQIVVKGKLLNIRDGAA